MMLLYSSYRHVGNVEDESFKNLKSVEALMWLTKTYCHLKTGSEIVATKI